jgi:hypothetical protein
MPDLPATEALTCSQHLAADGKSVDISLVLLVPTFSDLFVTLAESLIEAMVTAPDDDVALAELALRLAYWQEMFHAINAEGLSASARRGLVGELLLLRDDIIPVVGAVDAIEGWTGPLRANQDFQFSAVAIEVKCTTALHPQGFTVNNERELDDAGIGGSSLSLIHISLDERRGEGISLADLVLDVDGMLTASPGARTLFRERLARVGYIDSAAELYQEPLYNLREVHYFDVTEGFPRIVEADLADGVGQVEYRVSLAGCATFEIDRTVIRDRLGATDDF